MEQIHISIFAIVLASISLGWNIYRDLISRTSRVIVSGKIALIMSPLDSQAPSESLRKIVITAVNHGPADTTLTGFNLKIRKNQFFARQQSATVFCDYTNPHSSQLPCDLGVGKSALFMFPFDPESFLKLDLSQIGLDDVFGKTHWMKVGSVKKLRSGWRQEFETHA